MLFNSFYYLLITALLFIPCIGKPLPSLYTVGLAAVFGVINFTFYTSMLFAYATGPMSYSTVIVRSALIIPTFMGTLYGEPLKFSTFVGLALIIICLICSVDKKADEKKASLKWLVICLVGFLACGGNGVMQKIHQMSEYKGERDIYIFLAFFFATVISFIVFFFINRSAKKEEKAEFVPSGKNLLLLFFTGLGIAGINYINLYLSGVLPSALAYPLLNISAILLSVVVSLTFFHEKLSKKQTVGLVLGILAVVVICCF